MECTRRDLFRGMIRPGFWQQSRARIPMPYTDDPAALRTVCLACAAARNGAAPGCQTACGESIVRLDDAGVPYLDVSQAGCTYCGDCAAACGPAALDTDVGRRIAADIILARGGCLAWNRTMCIQCADRCPDRAVVFAGLWNPVVDDEACTRCGLCVAACPVDAIEITARVGGRP